MQPKHFRIKHRDKAVKSSLDDLPLSQDILQAEMKHNDTMIENLSKELEHQLNMAKQLIKDKKSNKDFKIVMEELGSIINKYMRMLNVTNHTCCILMLNNHLYISNKY